MPRENVETVWRAVDAFNRRDPVAFAEICVPEVEIVPLRAAMEGTVYRGRSGVHRFFEESDEEWGALSLGQAEIRDLGEFVLALGTLHARGRQSGAELEIHGGWILHFRDGLIAEVRTYISRDEALAAAGLSN
jgi:ketosteroid isomerase-like protein